jgi:NADPH:quinone reductase-like Zn-dependent oxidoreductase
MALFSKPFRFVEKQSTSTKLPKGGHAPADVSTRALGGGKHGMLTQYQVLDADGTVKFPEHLSYEEASTFACAGITAYNSLFEGKQSKNILHF